jgi:Predicted hydrolases or acyltransferases (alpha/beta hydrolase superfamily)
MRPTLPAGVLRYLMGSAVISLAYLAGAHLARCELKGSPVTLRTLVLLLLVSCGLPAHSDGSATTTQRFYEVRGAKVYVETFGSGAPIVFLHGGLVFFDTNFAKQRDYFAPFRKVIGIDRRGHGHSPDTAQPLSYLEMSEETAAVIEQLGLGPVDVVGHSDGGNIGLLLARDHPQLVRRLVISGANLRAGLTADELQRRSQWSAQQLAEKAREMGAKIPPSFRTDYEKVTPDGAEHWWTLLTKSYQLG